MASYNVELPEFAKREEVIDHIFNDDENVHGILIQLPLPEQHNATVTVIHTHTPNQEDMTRKGDILIAAIGKPNYVRGSWIKPGATVIDAGINYVKDPVAERGYRIVGDVCFDEACTIASAITHVPGGVGPMTIAMLLQNTMESARRAFKKDKKDVQH